jgi:hypothetical protein
MIGRSRRFLRQSPAVWTGGEHPRAYSVMGLTSSHCHGSGDATTARERTAIRFPPPDHDETTLSRPTDFGSDRPRSSRHLGGGTRERSTRHDHGCAPHAPLHRLRHPAVRRWRRNDRPQRRARGYDEPGDHPGAGPGSRISAPTTPSGGLSNALAINQNRVVVPHQIPPSNSRSAP